MMDLLNCGLNLKRRRGNKQENDRMNIDKLIFPLLPLIIAVIIGIMAGFLTTLIAVFSAIAVTLFIAGVGYNSSLLCYGAALFLILSILCACESLHRIICKDKFKTRISNYIAEGERIKANLNFSTVKTVDYIQWVKSWSEKVAKDIQRQKGQAEAELFFDKSATRVADNMLKDNSILDSEQRNYVVQITSNRLARLYDLQKRL